MTVMRILGIDPGLNITGYGVLEADLQQVAVVEAGVVRTNGQNSMADKLLQIGTEIEGVISQFHPDAIAIEELYSHYGHPQTAIVMGHARGVIFLKAVEAGVPIFPYASTRIKKSLTGNGRASKQQMQLMIKSTLHLANIPEPPDVADALAVALCHCRATAHNQVTLV